MYLHISFIYRKKFLLLDSQFSSTGDKDYKE